MLAESIYRHPSVWEANEFSGKSEISVPLDHHHLSVFENNLRSIQLSGIAIEEIDRSDFPIDEISDSIDSWHHEIQQGRGLLVLTGFPVDQFTKDQCAMVYWGLATHFGDAQSQSLLGDRLGHVVDVAGKDPRERAYRNSTELALHTDATDIIGMMCLVKASRGGVSGYASGPAVYNEIFRRSPESLATLCEGFHYHRFGEETSGQSPVTEHKVPVFSNVDGYLSVCYLRSYIEMAFDEMGVAKTTEENDALNLFDEIAHSPRFKFEFMMEPGDISLFNNYAVLHTRSEFFDDDDPDRKRHLLRLWLRAHQPRPVTERINAFGKRGGINKRKGGGTYYKGDLDYRESVPSRGYVE